MSHKKIRYQTYMSPTGRVRVWIEVDGDTQEKAWFDDLKAAEQWAKRKIKEYEQMAKAGLLG